MLHLAFRNLLHVVLLFLLSAGLAFGQTTAKFEVVSVRFVERLEGLNSTWTVKDASKSRAALVLIRATLTDDEPLWTPDFVLAYKRNGETDRSRCLGFGLGGWDSADGGPWMLGEYAKIKLGKGTHYFHAFFPLENEVGEISLLANRPAAQSFRLTAR